MPGSDIYVALASMVALLTGGYLLLARIFRLGFLADFLSRTVLVGFLTGVGVQVGIAMLSDMFGIAITSSNSLVRLWQIGRRPDAAALLTLALSGLVGRSFCWAIASRRVGPCRCLR